MKSSFFLAAAAMAGFLLAGCSSSSPTAGEASGGPAGDSGIRKVSAANLPPLADPSPTSDPTVEAAGPEGWKRLPRKDDQYLIGWYGGTTPNALPRIFIRVTEWTGQAGDTTKENVIALAEEIEQKLTRENKPVKEPPLAMVLGDTPYVRYVEDARVGQVRAEKQVLQRIANGRLYTVELQIYDGKILDSRDHAYAVAAGLKIEPSTAPAHVVPDTPEGDPTPSDTEPSDEPIDGEEGTES